MGVFECHPTRALTPARLRPPACACAPAENGSAGRAGRAGRTWDPCAEGLIDVCDQSEVGWRAGAPAPAMSSRAPSAGSRTLGRLGSGAAAAGTAASAASWPEASVGRGSPLVAPPAHRDCSRCPRRSRCRGRQANSPEASLGPVRAPAGPDGPCQDPRARGRGAGRIPLERRSPRQP